MPADDSHPDDYESPRSAHVMRNRTKSTIEIGAVLAAFLFLITLAFNVGIQYGQINTLNKSTESNTLDIRKLQIDEATNQAQISGSLARIETMVEDMRATTELRKTGAMH